MALPSHYPSWCSIRRRHCQTPRGRPLIRSNRTRQPLVTEQVHSLLLSRKVALNNSRELLTITPYLTPTSTPIAFCQFLCPFQVPIQVTPCEVNAISEHAASPALTPNQQPQLAQAAALSEDARNIEDMVSGTLPLKTKAKSLPTTEDDQKSKTAKRSKSACSLQKTKSSTSPSG